jgi:hypothetical protein
VQLALARQDEKEREQSDDGQRWSDDSYSPRPGAVATAVQQH